MKSNHRFTELIKTARGEISEFSAKRYALLGATITGLIFEWSPANEAVLGAIGIGTHERFGASTSTSDSVIDRIATGAVTGSASFIEQAIVGSLTAVSLSQFPKTFNKWQESRPENSLQTVSKSGSALTALGLGSSMAVLEKQIIDKSSSSKENIKLALKTSAIVGTANALLAASVSTGLDILDSNGQEQLSDNIADIAKNPLLYLGVFGVAKAIQYKKTKKSKQI